MKEANLAEEFGDVIDRSAEVASFFDDSSLPTGTGPRFDLIMGPTATGKTRYRRANYGRGYVVIDAGDIFISLSRGRYLDFPSSLEAPMDAIGAAIACRAVRERRNIVTEIIGCEAEPVRELIDAMIRRGYSVKLTYVHKDAVEAWEWNMKRSDTNISAYYAEPFHRRWLMGAVRETSAPALGQTT